MTLLGDNNKESFFKVEESFRLKNSENFETLNTIVSELKNTNRTYQSFDLNVNFNLEVDNLAVALRNIFGSKEPLAHVIIDENSNDGGIFSSDLVQEARSSEQCCLKILRIFESSGEKLSNLPIVIVTGSNKGIQIVVLLPSSLQIPSVCDSIVVYMIDPMTGNIDICKQTKKKLFFKYLERGSEAIGLKPVFKNVISCQKSHLSKCTSRIDSAYLCIIYCLFVLNDGNDEFINAEWSNILENLNVKKAALVNRIECLIPKQDFLPQPHISTKQPGLDKLYEIDSQIEEILQQNLLILKNDKAKFEQNSAQTQLDEMIKLEKTLQEKNENLRIQIKETEKLISDNLKSEPIELIGKSLTLEKKYKQFINGEERRRIEIDEQKKIQSVRSNLIEKNNNESRKIFQDQIEALMVLKESKEKEIYKFQNEITYLTSDEKKLGEKIGENEKLIKDCEIDLENKKNSKNFLLSNKNNSLIKAQNFNKLDIDNDPTKWILDVLNLKVYSNQNELNALKIELDNITNNINSINQNLKNLEINTNKLLTKRENTRVEINELENEVSELNEKICDKKSKLEEKKKEKDSYDTWYWRTYYFTIFNSLSVEVAELEKSITSLESDLNETNSNINSKNNDDDDLVKKIEENLHKKICLSKSLSEFSNKNILEQLKKIKNFLVNQFSTEQINIQNQINNTELLIIKIENDISLKKSKIKIDQDQIAFLQSKRHQIGEKIQLINLKINQFQDQINKMKQNLDNKNNSINNLQTKIIRAVDTNPKDYISSVILSESEFVDLINFIEFTEQKWYLLYRGSRDGFKSENFHNKCDGFSNTLTIIQTENKAVFGGYTGACWSKDGGFVEDQHSFIFSYYNTLNKKLMFECNRSLEAIYCEPNSGPSFGYNDVFISNECNSNLDSCCHIGYSYYNTINSYNSDESKIFLTGSDNFRVTEIEVFTKKSEKLSQDKIEKLCEKTGKNSKEIIEIYDTYNAVAINGQIKLNLFVAFLIRKNQNIETEKELKEMKRILNFVFEYFDQDKSGYLDFFEFIQCYFIFEEKNRKKSQKAILEFLFDLADKDKSQSLEIEEINDLLKKFPTILNRNNFASHLRDKVNLSSNKILARNDFSELLDLLFS